MTAPDGVGMMRDRLQRDLDELRVIWDFCRDEHGARQVAEAEARLAAFDARHDESRRAA